jgi:hypothetical protein
MLRITWMRRRIFVFIFCVGIRASGTPTLRHPPAPFAAQQLDQFYKSCNNHNFSPEKWGAPLLARPAPFLPGAQFF